MYDLGQIFPVYGQDKQGRTTIENYAHPDQTSKLVRLIHALFYRVPGSTGEADFGVTIQLASDDSNIVVALVAEIIVQCVQLQQEHDQFQRAVEYMHDLIAVIVKNNWLGKLGKKATRASLEQNVKDAQEKPWNRNVGNYLSVRASLLLKIWLKSLISKY